MMRQDGPEALFIAADRAGEHKELADLLLPILDCSKHTPVYQPPDESQKTTMQDVTIVGKIQGNYLPEGCIAWFPERGLNSVVLLRTLEAGTIAWEGTGNLQVTATRRLQIPVSAQRRYIQIEPDLELNFTVGRATHGQLHLFSATKSTTSTTLAGIVSAGNLDDYRVVDLSNGALLAQNSGENSSDGVPQAYLSDGISMLQGPDIRPELDPLGDTSGMDGDMNESIDVIYPNSGVQYTTGDKVFLGDGSWEPSLPFGGIPISKIYFGRGFGPLVEGLTYDLTYWIPANGSQPATAWTRVQLDILHLYLQYDQANNPVWHYCPQIVTFDTEIGLQQQGPGTPVGLPGSATYRTVRISVPGNSDAVKMGVPPFSTGTGTLVTGDGVMSAYLGTLVFHSFKLVNASVVTSAYLKSATATIPGHYKTGRIGPARIVSWTGAANQEITIAGTQCWQLVPKNTAAPILKRTTVQQETSEGRQLVNWLFNKAKEPIFRRVYVRSQWEETVSMLRRDGIAAVLARLKVSNTQLDAVRNSLRASASGLFSCSGASTSHMLGKRYR